MIQSVEKKITLLKISLLLGMQILVAAWDAVKKKTVVNCFRKSKISSDRRHNWRRWSFQGNGRGIWESMFNSTGPCFREHGCSFLYRCSFRSSSCTDSLIETMQRFSSFSKDGAMFHSYSNHAAHIIDQHFAEKSRQLTIRYYFQFVKKCFWMNRFYRIIKIRIIRFFLNFQYFEHFLIQTKCLVPCMFELTDAYCKKS